MLTASDQENKTEPGRSLQRIIYIMLNTVSMRFETKSMDSRKAPPPGATYDAVQSAADASSDAFTARAAVTALVAS